MNSSSLFLYFWTSCIVTVLIYFAIHSKWEFGVSQGSWHDIHYRFLTCRSKGKGMMTESGKKSIVLHWAKNERRILYNEMSETKKYWCWLWIRRVRKNTYSLLVGLQCGEDLLDGTFYENTSDQTIAFPISIQRRDCVHDESSGVKNWSEHVASGSSSWMIFHKILLSVKGGETSCRMGVMMAMFSWVSSDRWADS